MAGFSVRLVDHRGRPVVGAEVTAHYTDFTGIGGYVERVDTDNDGWANFENEGDQSVVDDLYAYYGGEKHLCGSFRIEDEPTQSLVISPLCHH